MNENNQTDINSARKIQQSLTVQLTDCFYRREVHVIYLDHERNELFSARSVHWMDEISDLYWHEWELKISRCHSDCNESERNKATNNIRLV